MALRRCTGTPAVWELPDLGDCVSKWMSDISKQVSQMILLFILSFLLYYHNNSGRNTVKVTLDIYCLRLVKVKSYEPSGPLLPELTPVSVA